MPKSFYITTPIYYVNDVPHIGHAYTTVASDTAARYRKMMGDRVFFLTGTDEHGLKIERAAQQQGLTPLELTDKYAAVFQEAWDRLDIGFDEFIRTTEPHHAEAVVEIAGRIKDSGFIYPGEYSGLYCVSCEAYVPEGEKTCRERGAPLVATLCRTCNQSSMTKCARRFSAQISSPCPSANGRSSP